MGEENYIAAYKMINSQLVASNQRLREEMKDKMEMINELNDELFKYREENMTLRDMFQRLQEQYNMVTKIMNSVRDKTELAFNAIQKPHLLVETEQQQRKPTAELVFEKRRVENPPYVDEGAIIEQVDEDLSMEDYQPIPSMDEDEDEEDEVRITFKRSSPLINRLGRRTSRNCSFDESLETIDPSKVVAAVRKSHEYLHGRESRGDKSSETERSKEVSATLVQSSETSIEPIKIEDPATKNSTIFETSSFSENSGVPSDQSTQSDLNPPTDQSLRPVGTMRRMASDSTLCSIVDRTDVTNNKENTIINDTISNATCSTPLAKSIRNQRLKLSSIHELSAMSPVPMVALKALTTANLREHDISFEAFCKASKKRDKQKLEHSDQDSLDSSDSKRPRRKAAPKTLKESDLRSKMRRE